MYNSTTDYAPSEKYRFQKLGRVKQVGELGNGFYFFTQFLKNYFFLYLKHVRHSSTYKYIKSTLKFK